MDTQTLERDPAVAAGIYCGPAIVLEADGRSLRLQLPGREAQAELALGYPYQPKPNDLVLALGPKDGDLYVVGVLQGSGLTALRVEGDLHVEATGRLKLSGRAGVEIDGARVAVKADRYELLARSVIERIGNAWRWAQGVITTSARRTRTVVEENATLAAGRIVEKAKKDVVIDGEQIRLG
jgi:hypothetical protein